MSEHELIERGVLCEDCGTVVAGEAEGFPRKCEDCKKEHARLIASAPDLLAALEDMADWVQATFGPLGDSAVDDSDRWTHGPESCSLFLKARTAIAAARGTR